MKFSGRNLIYSNTERALFWDAEINFENEYRTVVMSDQKPLVRFMFFPENFAAFFVTLFSKLRRLCA